MIIDKLCPPQMGNKTSGHANNSGGVWHSKGGGGYQKKDIFF